MTQTSDESEETLPSDWRWINEPAEVEVRRTGLATYQLRNPQYYCTINAEGFELYRKKDFLSFDKWLKANNIEGILRDDLES